jgi:hypothetical protein
MMILLPLLALVCIAGLALTAEAALKDNETHPNPQQYFDYDSAYVVDQLELGTRLELRKDGGGDSDYLKLPFLAVNDMVTVIVNQSEPTTTVEYWVSDPFLFPVYFYHYTGPPENPNFTFEFAAIMTGPYYIHTGQGFGPTYINFTITRQPMSPSSAKDTNNKPSDRAPLTSGVTKRQNAGMPWDPSDFWYINIQPTLLVNKYLTIDLEYESGVKAQWELYDTAGIQRPSLTYTSDLITLGSGFIEDRRITVPGDYILRIWMMEGYGQYNLTVSILSYPNDQDNTIDEATPIFDDSQASGDVNLSFDLDDIYEIYLEEGEPLWVRLTPGNGPVDLYIWDEGENQKRASRKTGLQEEFIQSWSQHDAGSFFIVVEAVYEAPAWENPPTVTYTLEVWINYAPNRVSGLPATFKNYHLDEDTIDTGYDVAALFEDNDGDELVYDLDMSYNNTLIDIQLQGDNTLLIEPEPDASGFKMEILLNATDPFGLMVNYTAFIWIDPVNDAPFVNASDIPEEITMGEDLVKSGVNVTKAFRDIDDDYTTWTFTATSTEFIRVELDEVTWLATFTPLVTDWFGVVTFTVTCFDSGDLNVSITLTINMYEINDPPVIIDYIGQVKMVEEGTYTIDLMDPDDGGPFFSDPEEKTLTYGFADNETLTVTIVGSLVTFIGQHNAWGIVSSLKIWAIDDLGATSSNLTIFIDVENLPDPPEVDAIITSDTVEEGEGVTFTQDVYYSFVDIDSTPFELVWKWYVDDVEVPPEQVDDRYAYEYVPAITAEKDRTVIVKLEVIDGDLDPQFATWTITITNKNVPPDEPMISAGTDNETRYKQGQMIVFTVTATDLDGDDLTYKWFLDELEEVGVGTTLELNNVKPGTHKVTVEVTDTSGTSSTKDFEFKIDKKSDGDDSSPGFGSVLVGLALLTMVGVMAARRRR